MAILTVRHISIRGQTIAERVQKLDLVMSEVESVQKDIDGEYQILVLPRLYFRLVTRPEVNSGFRVVKRDEIKWEIG